MEVESQLDSGSSGERNNKVGDENSKADFETSIAACGYGRFNYLLTLSFIPLTSSQLFASGVTAFILPAAQCDLGLTEFQKGTLNSASYIGSIIGGLLCGTAGDKYGRQKVMVFGYLAEAACTFLLGFVTVYWLFFLLRVIIGILIAAPNAVMMAYVAETHTDRLRAKTIMWVGMGYALAGVLHPVLAYAVIPLPLRLPLPLVELTSWRVFVMLSAVPSLVSGLVCLCLPESPKFLMSQGRDGEALRVLRRIYSLNTGRDPNTYPVAVLSCTEAGASVTQTSSKAGCLNLQQFRTLLGQPHIFRLVHISAIQFAHVLCLNTVRLWTPQLFSLLSRAAEGSAAAPSICGMIASTLGDPQQPVGHQDSCLPVSGEVYLRSVLIGSVSTLSFLFTSHLIGWIGKKMLLLSFFPAAAAVALGFSWAADADWLMALLAILSLLTANLDMAVSAVQVDLFPTSVRALAYSLMLLAGRLGTISGNLILPILLAGFCDAIFYGLCGCFLACFLLAWMLPSVNERE